MPKGFPEITCKSNIPIRNYALGETIQLDNLIKIEFCNSGNICGLSTRNKMGHLREAVDYHKNRIMFLCSTWKPKQNPCLHLAKGKWERATGCKDQYFVFYAWLVGKFDIDLPISRHLFSN